jgi:hypothetical protein
MARRIQRREQALEATARRICRGSLLCRRGSSLCRPRVSSPPFEWKKRESSLASRKLLDPTCL